MLFVQRQRIDLPRQPAARPAIAELALELDEIAFPMAELAAFAHDVGTMENAQFRAEPAAMAPTGMPRSAPGTTFGQVVLQFALARPCANARSDRWSHGTHACGYA